MQVISMDEHGQDEGFSFSKLAKQLESKMKEQDVDPLATGTIMKIASADSLSELRASSTAIVLFYRTECPYCKQLFPLLQELAETYRAHVAFAQVNLDVVQTVTEEFDIYGVPLVIAFKKGMTVSRIEGLRSYDEYDSWIDSIKKGLRPMRVERGDTTRLSD
jgi:thioredoxin-like negative regulator of GroEL